MRFLATLPWGSRLERAWRGLSPEEQQVIEQIRPKWDGMSYQEQIDTLFVLRQTDGFREFSLMQLATIFDVHDETEM